LATLTLSIIALPDQSVDLHAEPLHLARQLMASIGANGVEIPDLGVETDNGRVYDLDEVEVIEPRLEAAIATIDRSVSSEQHFNERQELRAALGIFRSARACRSGVELGV
jgi:hypothetical protein